MNLPNLFSVGARAGLGLVLLLAAGGTAQAGGRTRVSVSVGIGVGAGVCAPPPCHVYAPPCTPYYPTCTPYYRSYSPCYPSYGAYGRYRVGGSGYAYGTSFPYCSQRVSTYVNAYPSTSYRLVTVDGGYAGGYAGGYDAGVIRADSSPDAYRDMQRTLSQRPITRLPEPVVEPVLPPQPPPDTAADISRAVAQGWLQIAKGNEKEALGVFATACEASPGSAPPKAGFAVAAVLLGQEQTALWAMRRAFTARADTLGYLPADQQLTSTLSGLSQQLRASAQAGKNTPDRWFLIAAIEYLNHDASGAAEAARRARELGDSSESLRNLQSLLG